MASDRAIRPAQGPSKGFIIAGPASGVGKTTVALSLMAALRRRGLTIQPFKCGPDFIDGGHYARVCGRTSRNLDGWMVSADANREIFCRSAAGAALCVVEGMMGLFDGADGKSEAGSTAEIAKWLRLPVILVVDASSIARSAAALVHGFETFDPALKLAGVIFNRVGGPAHYRMLKDALTTSANAVSLGYLPRDERIHIPERYLGLFTAGENLLPDSVFRSWVSWRKAVLIWTNFWNALPPFPPCPRMLRLTMLRVRWSTRYASASHAINLSVFTMKIIWTGCERPVRKSSSSVL